MATVTTPSVRVRLSEFAALRPPPSIISKRIPTLAEKMPWWRNDTSVAYNGSAFLAVDRKGVLTGKETLDETPVVGTLVCLFYLPSMLLIRTGRTDANGDFSFDGLDRTANKYVAVARIPPHNAMIFDTLTPA
jgi:hypothetical protein